MKRLFLLLAVVGMLATACEDNGFEERGSNPLGTLAGTPNEILYTTKYGLPIVELGNVVGFGANLVYNTYENGIGRLIFDNDVTAIPKNAFKSCLSLTGVTIPGSVTSIGDSAFSGCTSLITVYGKPEIPPLGGSGMFSKKASSLKIYVPTESVCLYRPAQYWSAYADSIVGYDF